jgi:hypothetical protein
MTSMACSGTALLLGLTNIVEVITKIITLLLCLKEVTRQAFVLF